MVWPESRSGLMPSKSKAQQSAAGIALAVKEGRMPKSELFGSSADMARTMTRKQLRDFARTDRAGLPNRVKKK